MDLVGFLFFVRSARRWGTHFRGFVHSVHVSTPLVLPVRSDLHVHPSDTERNAIRRTLRIHRIGRVVNP